MLIKISPTVGDDRHRFSWRNGFGKDGRSESQIVAAKTNPVADFIVRCLCCRPCATSGKHAREMIAHKRILACGTRLSPMS